MNRKRIEHTAGILRDLGLAASIGGVGDMAINPGSGRGLLDFGGAICGLYLLLVSVYVVGVDLRRKGD